VKVALNTINQIKFIDHYILPLLVTPFSIFKLLSVYHPNVVSSTPRLRKEWNSQTCVITKILHPPTHSIRSRPRRFLLIQSSNMTVTVVNLLNVAISLCCVSGIICNFLCIRYMLISNKFRSEDDHGLTESGNITE
jgi:hypothetical protein